PSRGANSMHVMRMCQAMAQLGHEVTLHVRPGDAEAPGGDHAFYGVEPVFSIAKHPRPAIRGIGAAINALRARRALAAGPAPDLLYAREVWALALATSLGIPFVFESHWAPRDAAHRLVEKAILRHPGLRRVVLISEALRQIYLREFPWLDPGVLLVAHDAADPQPRSEGGARSGRPGALQVGYVGSFQPGCGIELVIELARRSPEDDFHVFGGSADEVSRWSGRAGDIANLTFHGFVVPRELHRAYASLDVVLAPYDTAVRSLAWMSPMKLFEYMAHGKAILCSDIPVLREILHHGETALLVEPARPSAWASALARLRESEAERRRLGEAARAALEAEHTWQVRARR